MRTVGAQHASPLHKCARLLQEVCTLATIESTRVAQTSRDSLNAQQQRPLERSAFLELVSRRGAVAAQQRDLHNVDWVYIGVSHLDRALQTRGSLVPV